MFLARSPFIITFLRQNINLSGVLTFSNGTRNGRGTGRGEIISPSTFNFSNEKRFLDRICVLKSSKSREFKKKEKKFDIE